MTNYEIEFHHSTQGSDLAIHNEEGDLIACFVGDRAVKLFLLLMAFPTVTERDIYLNARITDLINMDF